MLRPTQECTFLSIRYTSRLANNWGEPMTCTRRALIGGLGASLFAADVSWADDRLQYTDYDYFDYFVQRGQNPSLQKDIDAANRIVDSLPTDNYFSIMQRLSRLAQVGSTGEPFNTRWKTFANPLIVRFFHDIGYARTLYPGDCTPWCAAAV